VKGEHQVVLSAGAEPKPQKFDKDDAKDDLYNWNNLRSQYMAEANNQMAAEYTGPYAGPGWYWNPWSFGYAYMGMGPFASPFGWGFYPYRWGGYYPYGFYGGYYGHPRVIHRGGYVGSVRHGYVGGAVRGNPGHIGAMHNGGTMAPSGGAHFGGGFHSGTAGGGLHGGGRR